MSGVGRTRRMLGLCLTSLGSCSPHKRLVKHPFLARYCWMPSRKPVKKSGLVIGLFALCAATTAAGALPRKMPPVDDCARDPRFVEFRKALRDAAQREDGKALVAMFAPKSERLGAGSPEPPAHSDPSDIMPTEDWIILQTILRMGCKRVGAIRVTPSVSVQLDRYSADSLKGKVLVLAGAKLFGVPYEEKSVLASLAWDVATAVGTGGDLWTRIRLADGREGWVADDRIYWMDPSSRHEITFEKRLGKWMITGFGLR